MNSVLFNLGLAELIILLLVGLLLVWPFWRIFARAGFPGFLAFGMLLPLVNLGLILFLAFADWPAFQRSSVGRDVRGS